MLVRLRRAVFRVAYASNDEEVRRLPVLEKSLLPLLSAISVLYKCLLALRCKLYQWHILTQIRLPIPVISVGNLSWGGNGKTPMVEYLAWQFLQCGIPPLLLIRGYKNGDEVRLLEGHLQGTRALIGVGSDRVKAATAVLTNHGVLGFHGLLSSMKNLHFCTNDSGLHRPSGLNASKFATNSPCQVGVGNWEHRKGPTKHRNGMGVVLMDDGMQHWKINRDIEIVMINAISPFGNGWLLPRGPLREPLEALCRADVVAIHHANLVSHAKLNALMQRIKLSTSAGILCTQMVPHSLGHIPRTSRFIGKDRVRSILPAPLHLLKNALALCISGIGCPVSLTLNLEEDLTMIKRRLCELQKSCQHDLVIVTTEKDYTRCPDFFWRIENYDVFILCSMLEIINDSRGMVNLDFFIAQKLGTWKA